MRPVAWLLSILSSLLLTSLLPAADQPNILWLTVEDIGPHLGCYGDSYATTPNLDAFAKKSTLYWNAWSNAPVCAPARTTLITGVYPPSLGAEHMRSLVPLPKGMKTYPELMRDAGYFCINPGKTDYNVEVARGIWDQTQDRRDPWTDLKANQPFLAVLNNTKSHESQIRTRPHDWVHDPAQFEVPPYHPDTQETREDWAQYYDNITVIDDWFQEQLDQLEAQGLAEDTIVFFYGDHGSGMPRHKRVLFDTGLRVPLLIYVPEKFQHLCSDDMQPGGRSDRLVSFVDFAPTLLSLAGKPAADYHQGSAFMGEHVAPPQDYMFGFRGRMDERVDLIRSVRTDRYHYVKNYMPNRPIGQHVAYMFQTPTTAKWWELYEQGELTNAQAQFWQRRQPEELYDLETDPYELNNLANSEQHREILEELREAHRDHVFRIRDLGFLPEDELHTRAPDMAPYDVGHSDKLYPLKTIFEVAQKASSLNPTDTPQLVDDLSHPDSAVRYWAAMGLLCRGESGYEAGAAQLRKAVQNDPSENVRTIAAEAVALYGDEAAQQEALAWLLEAANGEKHQRPYLAVLAMNSIDNLDEKAAPIEDQLRQLPTTGDWDAPRGASYILRLMEKTLADLESQQSDSE